jgi:hypothetical protein
MYKPKVQSPARRIGGRMDVIDTLLQIVSPQTSSLNFTLAGSLPRTT